MWKHHTKKWFAVLVSGFLLCASALIWIGPAYAEDDEEQFTDFLPFGKQYVIQKGMGDKLPLPCGFSWNFVALRQDMGLKSIDIQCSKFDPLFDIIDPIIQKVLITSDNIETKNYSCNLRFDVWILPFLNVYGILGYVDGNTLANAVAGIDPSADVSDLVDMFTSLGLDVFNSDGSINLGKVSKLLGVPIDRISFDMTFSGYNYGCGFTLAGGYGNYFAVVDTNYVYSDLDIADSTIETTTCTLRFGREISIGDFNGSIHIGAMWMQTEEKQTGWVDYAGVETNYETITESTEPWNYLAGIRWTLSKQIGFLFEAGYGRERETAIVMAEYRF